MSADDPHYRLDPEERAWWAENLAEFKREVFPLFEAHGFTMAEAMLAWKLSFLRADIQDLKDLLVDEDPDRNAPWRRPPGEEEPQ